MTDNLAGETDVRLAESWCEGDEDAAAELFRRYVEKLLNVVRGQITRRIRARVDPDDVVQSAFRSVFFRLRERHFQFKDDEAFWKLLLTVALNKTRNTVRNNRALVRDASRDQQASAYIDTIRQGPTAMEVIIFADLLESILDRLSHRERQLILLRVESGLTQKEIAARLKVDVRTVRRLSRGIYERVAAVFDEGAGAAEG